MSEKNKGLLWGVCIIGFLVLMFGSAITTGIEYKKRARAEGAAEDALSRAHSCAQRHYALCRLVWPPTPVDSPEVNVAVAVGGSSGFLGGRGGDANATPGMSTQETIQYAALLEAARLGFPSPSPYIKKRPCHTNKTKIQAHNEAAALWTEYANWFEGLPRKKRGEER